MEPTTTDPMRVCGHRYRSSRGIEYICLLEDHPRKPNGHYFSIDDNKVSPARLESDLEDHFRRAVARAGGAAFKLVATRAGMPDRLVLMPGGRIYLVELKAHGGEVRPDQKIWHAKARGLGTVVVVLEGRGQVDGWVHSVHEEIKAEMESLV